MSDKVQLIKEEIERLKEHTAKCGYPGQGEFENGNREGRNWVCDKLLQFIDSLPEELASEDFEEELDNFLKDLVFGKLINRNAGLVLARHFAEWQKKKDQQTIELAEDHAMMAGYDKGYDKAMQDFLKKSAKFFDDEFFMSTSKFEQFKKYLI